VDKFTDLAFARDASGCYDLVLDPDTADFAVEQGMASALFISLFSDGRARDDQRADPMLRRGWTGDTMAETAGDRHGSMLWLYEQHRNTDTIAAQYRFAAEASLYWLVTERLLASVSAVVLRDPATRRFYLGIDAKVPSGGAISQTYPLADATRTGELARNT
jgi:phage gp46-like protein